MRTQPITEAFIEDVLNEAFRNLFTRWTPRARRQPAPSKGQPE
ncbi:hypothetical protein ACN9JG_06125 [Cereibacter azotoformans]